MTVKKKPAIPNYEAFGDELSPAVAYLQAASLLDISAGLAIESRDVESLTAVSVLWMRLAESLMGGARPGTGDEDEEEVDELSSEPRQPVGFAGAIGIKEIEVEEDE